MFGSLLNVVKDVATIVTAPVEIALDVTSAVTKPIADTVSDAVKGIKEELTDNHNPK